MKFINKTIFANLSHLWASLRGNGLAQKLACVEPPLRAELFSADQMEQHGKNLAGSHELSPVFEYSGDIIPIRVFARIRGT